VRDPAVADLRSSKGLLYGGTSWRELLE
jgi:hypothetical protein